MSEVIGSSTKKPVKKAALGRGLGSLLAAPTEDLEIERNTVFKAAKVPALSEGFIEPETTKAEPKVSDLDRVWQIAIENLITNPKQPRQIFVKEALEELANSIKQNGILQPIVARKLAADKFEIIAGERRWRAAQLAGLKQVPVILKESNDQKSLELALIENIQRADLNPIEEAEAYHHLIEKYMLTQQEMADKVGKDRATVANAIRLLQLTKEVREWVASGALSSGHAKILLAVTDPKKQKDLAQKMMQEKLSVRAAERCVAELLKAAQGAQVNKLEKLNISSRLMKDLSEELQKLTGTKTTIDYTEGRGKLSIHFYSDEQMNTIIEKIRTSWRKN